MAFEAHQKAFSRLHLLVTDFQSLGFTNLQLQIWAPPHKILLGYYQYTTYPIVELLAHGLHIKFGAITMARF